MPFPFYKQYDTKDCGPTCLMMISKYYGKSYSLHFFREKCQITRRGVSLLSISTAAESIGCKTLSAKITYEDLLKEGTLPCIAYWKQSHFVVVYKINKRYVHIADPAKGLIKIPKSAFLSSWINIIEGVSEKGVILFIEPTSEFNRDNIAKDDQKNKLKITSIASYFVKYKNLFVQLGLSFFIGSALQMMLPFLTQAVVDVGIGTADKSFILLILLGQTMILIGTTVVDFVRSWILLHISTRVNISLLANFFIKLMRLPLSYFDSKVIGDIMQRMNDHSRIQSFLTNSVTGFLFTMINFIIYTIVIVMYDSQLFLIFIIGSLVYLTWILLFLRIRKNIDYLRFDVMAKSQSCTIQLIQGIQDIKLNNSEITKRWEWERLQAKSFRLGLKSLSVNQIQQGGAIFLNQGKNVLITYLTATKVVDGQMTLGGMLAVQFIIGQLNGPIQQFIQFIQAMQDAKISLDRINEIHSLDIEEPSSKYLLSTLPPEGSIILNNVSYKYPGFENDLVLKNINLRISEGKITAIVGTSGSGKTTLLKLLQKFYEPTSGTVNIGSMKMSSISHSFWRSKCGVVMQDGFIFSATVAENIAASAEYPDIEKVIHAAEIANIRDFIESLPLGYNTIIGAEGTGLSQGQRQRILIARAVYKDPAYVFFDEATNALDANNELEIMKNFAQFFKNRTAVIVAHRLSTVKNADQIIVMENGIVAETGTHEELVEQKGKYFNLVKNQLELSN